MDVSNHDSQREWAVAKITLVLIHAEEVISVRR
jgi:hypothetical protein